MKKNMRQFLLQLSFNKRATNYKKHFKIYYVAFIIKLKLFNGLATYSNVYKRKQLISSFIKCTYQIKRPLKIKFKFLFVLNKIKITSIL